MSGSYNSREKALLEGTADLEEFFTACDALHGPAQEPDWEEHQAVINDSRGRGAAVT